jgi:uncharacterized protein (DUF58 family)
MSTRQVYHALGFLCLLFALFSGSRFLWLFGGFFFFMTLAHRWWRANLPRWVRLEWSADQSRVMPGTPVTVRFSLHNRSWLPLPGTVIRVSFPEHVTVEGADDVTASSQRCTVRFRFHLPLRTSAERTFTLTPHKRGLVWLTEAQADTLSVFGEEQDPIPLPLSFSLLVYPLPLTLPPLSAAAAEPDGGSVSRRRLEEDVTFLRGVRGYAPGDRLKHIHWKASAKTGALQTRLFEPTARPTWKVVGHILPSYEPLLQRQNETVNERVISALAALSVLCRRQSLSCDLFLTVKQRGREQFHLPAGSGKAHHVHVMTQLARLHQYMPTSLAAVLRRLEHSGTRDAILIVTPRLDGPAEEAVKRLVRRGHSVTVLDVSEEQPVLRRHESGRTPARKVVLS